MNSGEKNDQVNQGTSSRKGGGPSGKVEGTAVNDGAAAKRVEDKSGVRILLEKAGKLAL